MASSTGMVSGIVSGMDWATIVDQLISIDHKRVDLVEKTRSDYEKKLSEWQSFNTRLLVLKTAAEGLKDIEDFKRFTASMSIDSTDYSAKDLLSVSTGSSAAAGTYSITVKNLAAAQKLSSNPFTGKTSELGSAYAGDIVINGRVVTIGAADSLTDVASAINNANTGTDPTGVSASVINYGTNDYRLILTSNTTGEKGISLLNGSSANLVQKFGWKDKQAAVVKNPITAGAQSDRFTAQNVAIQSLLGLSTGEASTGALTINGTAVNIDLATDSLTDIKDAIDALAGVSASVISETEGGKTYYRLQIEGSQTFADEKNILNTLGILHNNSAAIAVTDSEVSANALTSKGAAITRDTLLSDIDGYVTYTAGDNIQLTGFQTGGGAVSSTFGLSSSTTVGDLLDEIESQYASNPGDVVAYLTSDGKIRVDDAAAGGSLEVALTAVLGDAGSQLDFGAFGDAAAVRKREILAGQDAVIEVDGVEVTRSSNTVDDVISGVTLNLLKADAASTITLEIEHDLDTIKSNISNFVESYNAVMSYVNSQFKYDMEDQKPGGPLFGDGTLSSVKRQMMSLLTDAVWGVNSNFSRLALVGITMGNDLLLSIDNGKLTGYLETNFNDVVSLFVGQGTVSGSQLSYVGHSRDTKPGEYTVHIDRAATRGTETGSVDLRAGGAHETLTITQGDSTATVALTAGMALEDIVNEINTELATVYTEVLVGDQQILSGASAASSMTKWAGIDGTTLQDGDVISFSGTARNGGAVSGSYTIDSVSSDSIQGLLSAIEDAFSSKVSASIDSSGRLVVTDRTSGPSKLSIDITEPTGRGLDFGAVDVTAGAGDGSREGRYAMAITATHDGSGHLVLRSDNYGTSSFTIAQDTSDHNYNHIVFTEAANTTGTSNGAVYISGQAGGSNGTAWNDISGAGVTTGETITISGKDHTGAAIGSVDYTIDTVNDTVDDLLTDIQAAFGGTGSVDVFIKDGKIMLEDKTAGSSLMELTLAYNGAGSLSLGTFDQSTERDLDLGLINGTVSGQNVAGTINGEEAAGSGQVLTGNSGNINTARLSMRYTGTSDNTDAGTIKVTVGVAELFERTLFNITDSVEGYVAYKQDSLQARIGDLKNRISDMEYQLDLKAKMLTNKFLAMELAIGRLQNQSIWLAGQITTAASAWK